MHCFIPILLTIGALATQSQGALIYLSGSVINAGQDRIPQTCASSNCGGTPVSYILDQQQNNVAYYRAGAAVQSAALALAKNPSITALPAAAVQSRVPADQWMAFTSVQNILQSLQSNVDTTGAGYKAQATGTGSATSAASTSGSSGASSASGSASATPASASAASATSTNGPSAASSARSSGTASRATGAAIGAMVGAVAGLAYAL